MKTEIHRKDGLLSAYGFACGYIMSKRSANIEVILHKEFNTYHLSKFKNGERVSWASYQPNQLTKARKFFKDTHL